LWGIKRLKSGNLSTLLQSLVFMALVKVSPRIVSFHVLWWVTWIYFVVYRGDRELIRDNIREAFEREWGDRDTDSLVKSTLRGISHHYFEKRFLACTREGEWREFLLERIRISRRRVLDRSLAENRGVILVTAHFGAVEFLPGYLALLGYPVSIIARFKTPRLKMKCEKRARAIGAKIIDAGVKNSLTAALSALREGRILITQCDEVDCWKPDGERALSLFGLWFRLDRTVSVLQKRSGASIVFGYVRREKGGWYTAEIDDIAGHDGASTGRVEETILKRLEKLVCSYPDQWYIWTKFHLMKATSREDICIEDRKCGNLPVAPTPFPVLPLPRGFTGFYGQPRHRASV
jgi:lauroyl/myristoyl acyltransferase